MANRVNIVYPRHDYVLVEACKEPTTTESGIIIKSNSKGTLPKGIVMIVGKDVTDLKEGYIVFFNQYSATKVDEDSDFFLVRNQDIIGIDTKADANWKENLTKEVKDA